MTRRANSGYVLLASLILLSSAAAGAFTHAIAKRLPHTADLRERREIIRGLRDAQLALISHGLIEDNTPGTLPAPSGENMLNGRSSPIGFTGTPGQGARRLPWHFLALPPAPGGQCLWYAVGRNFRNSIPTSQRNAQNDTAINPQTIAPLRMLAPDADSAAPGAAAIVIAPGRPLAEQTGRSHPPGLNCSDGSATAFLENVNADASESFMDATQSMGGSNDILLALTPADLLRPALPRVLHALRGEGFRDALRSWLIALPHQGTLGDVRCTREGTDGCIAPALFDAHLADMPPERLSYINGCPGLLRTGNTTDFSQAASWLCFNDWFSHIHYDRTLSLLHVQAGDTSGRHCELDLETGEIRCRQTGS